MKKILISILTLICMISGCGNSEFKYHDVEKIVFSIGDHDYEIAKEKIQDVVDIFENIKVEEKEDADESECEEWAIEIYGKTTKKYWINLSGELIYETNDKYFKVIPKEQTVKNLYSEVMGKNIFLGEIDLNEEWIVEDLNRYIFFIDKNAISEIKMNHDQEYTISNENKDKIIEALNKTIYSSKEETDWLTQKNPLTLYYQNTTYTICLIKGDEETYLTLWPENNEGNHIYYTLENSILEDVYQEVFGNSVFD